MVCTPVSSRRASPSPWEVLRHLGMACLLAPLAGRGVAAAANASTPSAGNDAVFDHPATGLDADGMAIDLVDARSQASLYGPQNSPRAEHLRGVAGDENTFFNAMLAALARTDPALVRARIRSITDTPVAALYEISLNRGNGSVSLPVDSYFFRRGGAKDGTFEGNAIGVTCLTEAYWPAVMQAAFVKELDRNPAPYFVNATFSAPQEADQFQAQPLPEGYDRGALAAPQPSLAVLAPGPLQTLQLGPVAPQALRPLLQQIGRGEAVGVLALLRTEEYVRARGYRPPAADAPQGRATLAFVSGNQCTLPALAQPAVNSVDCTTATGEPFYLRTQAGYVVYGESLDGRRLRAHDAHFGPYNPSDVRDSPHANTTLGRAFAVPVTLLVDLNATLYFANLSPGTTRPPPTSPEAGPATLTRQQRASRSKDVLRACGYNGAFLQAGLSPWALALTTGASLALAPLPWRSRW